MYFHVLQNNLSRFHEITIGAAALLRLTHAHWLEVFWVETIYKRVTEKTRLMSSTTFSFQLSVKRLTLTT